MRAARPVFPVSIESIRIGLRLESAVSVAGDCADEGATSSVCSLSPFDCRSVLLDARHLITASGARENERQATEVRQRTDTEAKREQDGCETK